MNPTDSELCRNVDEAMAELIEGSAPEALYEHIMSCDRCRDARHEAEQAAALVADSAADYVHPADFDARIEAALDEADNGPTTQPLNETPVITTGVAAVTGRAASTASKTEAMAAVDAPALVDPPKARRAEVFSMARWLRRPRNTAVAALVGAAAVAATVSLVMAPPTEETADVEQAWSGKVAKISRAAGGEGGLSICNAQGAECRPASEGVDIAAGSVLETDDRTRAYIELADGTRLALDRSTELRLRADANRSAVLSEGAIVADVKPIEGSKALFGLPNEGQLEVVGTKFALRTMGLAASVDVSRGSVILSDKQQRSVKVRAGEEGRVYPEVPPYATSSPSLSDALSWSESGEEEEIVVRGLGELKAKKPGEDGERQGAVRLTSHKVKVRIVDGFARTEVEEVFSNTTDDVLEGIFRFPLPPDAQIERLALEVDGVMEEGAFVDRDRAAAIWRGAIVNANRAALRPREEIIWVAGPWKDPALLEWQRGGRFELRIFPIPKQGSRRVVLTYTQTVDSTAGVRRYVYPLAHDPSGDLRVDDFAVDVQVRGHDADLGVSTAGYQLSKSGDGAAEKLSMHAARFVPSGDLVVEYATANRDKELSAWAYRPASAPADSDAERAEGADGGATETAVAVKADAKADALRAVADDRPYVAMTLRPKLPRWSEDLQRAYVIVVDASRSMFGERYRRAGALASRVVGELDRLDRFTVMACDTQCRSMPGGLREPGYAAAGEVKQFLEAVTPEGGSDPTASLREAGSVASQSEDRALRVVYIGDGTPTVGPIRPAYITRAVQDALPTGQSTLTAVAIGADADLDALGAMARGGGGTVLPYVPGQKVSEAAYAILGASYGMGLRDVTVELPPGLDEVAPKQLDTIAAGGETLLTARMTAGERVSGDVVLRGKVGDKAFEQRYPLEVVATSDAGNAFVPRLYAAERIADLERDGDARAQEQAVALSSAFNVASRYTSLLVLESDQMFKAFGLDNERRVATWTGEVAARGVDADGVDAYQDEGEDKSANNKKSERANFDEDDSFGGDGLGTGSGFGRGPSPVATHAPRTASKPMAPPSPQPSPASEPPAPLADRENEQRKAPARRPAQLASPNDPPAFRERRGWVPMRRIFERQATIFADRQVPLAASPDKIADAQREVDANDNRRAAVKQLYTLLALAGDVDRAFTLAERWSEKEALDPDALTARADLAARRGQREEAIRVLGSVLDVRPGDVASHKRLARLHRWAGREAVGCRHALAAAQLHPKDAELLADAVFCGRRTGENAMVEDMLRSAEEKVRKAAETRLKNQKEQADRASGDVVITATWDGGVDLDIGLIHPQGHRVSWLGAPTKALISAEDVTSTRREVLGLLGSPAGEYAVEVVRASGEGPVRGELTIRAAGNTRKIPFVLDDNRQTVATMQIFFQSRLVPF